MPSRVHPGLIRDGATERRQEYLDATWTRPSRIDLAVSEWPRGANHDHCAVHQDADGDS
jgi:hypothetical protein